MPSMADTKIIGHLGKDAKIKELDGDKYCATFSVAVTDKYRKDGKWVDGHTEWYRCVAWNNVARLCKDLRKGNAAYVHGRMRTREYTDDEGIKRWITELNARSVYKLEYQRKGTDAPEPDTVPDEYDIGDLGPPIADGPLSPGD